MNVIAYPVRVDVAARAAAAASLHGNGADLQPVPVMWHRWAPAWLGLAGLATANGAVRQTLYAEPLGDLAAHQLSTAVLIGVSGGYVWLLQRRWSLPSTDTALRLVPPGRP